MRVIITGGTGLIGQALSDDLLKGGYEVVVLSRSPERAHSQPEGVNLVKWDASTVEGWGHLVDGAYALIHLSGANLAGEGFFPSRWTQKRKQIIGDSRVKTSRAIVDAISQAQDKPEVVVQAHNQVRFREEMGTHRLSHGYGHVHEDREGVVRLIRDWLTLQLYPDLESLA